jgi:transcriptional regulator with XRE-family HTH domain
MIENLGKYIAELRVQRGLTLRKMEDLTGIPNAYLSQLETGQKKYLPSPPLLSKLSECLGVSNNDLLAKAGYLKQSAMKESLEKQVDKAFRHAVSDPQFRYGAALKNKYDFNIKRFVVELYEKATARSILKDASSAEHTQGATDQMPSANPPLGPESGAAKTPKKRAKKTSTEPRPPDKGFMLRSIRKQGL